VGLALGADRAIHVDTEQALSPLIIAKTLQQIVLKEQCQLVLLGKQAIDGDNSQTGPMLAGLLNWPQASFASKIVWENEEIIVTCEVDGGLQTLGIHLPAVVTTDLRLNTPRYASLPNIMKAKSKPLDVIALSSLGLSCKLQSTQLEVITPPARKAGIMVQSVQELVDKLRHEAKVIP
jgi:electron transfer flavoprotein beta subunit